MRVIVTGIGSRLAQLVAGVLAARPHTSVLAWGTPVTLPDVESLDRMPRGDELTDTLRSLRPDFVIHLDQPGELTRGGRAGQLQTFDLLGSCEAAGVERVILRSSTHVYGAMQDHPAFLTETAALQPSDTPGLQTDYVAIEQFAQATAARGKLRITTLRCAPVIGPQLRSPFARYLRNRQPLVLPGYNPRIQVLNLEDAVIGFALAALSESSGAFNLAAADPLPLDRAIRLAGRQPVPVPALALSNARLTHKLTDPIRANLPFDPAFLQYACVADTQRAQTELGWQPRHSAADTIAALRNK